MSTETLVLASLAALALAACAGGRAVTGQRFETGLASHYAEEFQGRHTASGEPYDGRRLTCAHRSHPFGAWLEVTNLENGRKVRVRVNDRGPFAEGRVVDLSREAARRLGILGRGLVRVRLVRVARASPSREGVVGEGRRGPGARRVPLASKQPSISIGGSGGPRWTSPA